MNYFMLERAKDGAGGSGDRYDQEKPMKTAFIVLAAAFAIPAGAQITTSTSTTTTRHESNSEITPPVVLVRHAHHHHHVQHHTAAAAHVTSATVKAPAGSVSTSTATTVTKQ